MHPPASSAPVCADPTSFKKPSPGIPSNLKELSNGEIASLVLQDKVKDHQLENLLDPHRAVEVRRLKVDVQLDSLGRGGALTELPYKHDLDYKRVLGANCEIVVGYIPIPVGMAGPKFASNASTYLDDSTSLLQFLIIWSICMCYFFGFFGISFIELDDLESEPQNHQHKVPFKPMPTTNNER